VYPCNKLSPLRAEKPLLVMNMNMNKIMTTCEYEYKSAPLFIFIFIGQPYPGSIPGNSSTASALGRPYDPKMYYIARVP
jgi:hypothetical protein